ncbi:hypothetical protein G6F40_016176 [Rhizopus arrhizus]|nr:hypothetical protein G6F40_016176 [Rhizopus arrhizus]
MVPRLPREPGVEEALALLDAVAARPFGAALEEQWLPLAGLQQRADARGQFCLVAAIAGQAFAQWAFLRRRQHGTAVDALAQALRRQLAEVAADRIFRDGIAARQVGGHYAALLAQFLKDLLGPLGGKGAGIGAHTGNHA